MKGTEVMAMPRDVVVLSDDQFNKLVELLTPGYELALLYKASMTAAPSDPPTDPIEPVESTGAEGQAALAANQASA